MYREYHEQLIIAAKFNITRSQTGRQLYFFFFPFVFSLCSKMEWHENVYDRLLISLTKLFHFFATAETISFQVLFYFYLCLNR